MVCCRGDRVSDSVPINDLIGGFPLLGGLTPDDPTDIDTAGGVADIVVGVAGGLQWDKKHVIN